MAKEMTYRIVRFFQNGPPHREVIASGYTLEEAQAHCSDPETSSKTAVGRAAQRTNRRGPWFDGYEREE